MSSLLTKASFDKKSSMEKKALSPELLLRAARVAKGRPGGGSHAQIQRFLNAAMARINAAEDLAYTLHNPKVGYEGALRMMKTQLDNAKKVHKDMAPFLSMDKVMQAPNYGANRLLGLKWFNRNLKALEEQFPSPEVAKDVVKAVTETAPAKQLNPLAAAGAALGGGLAGGTILGFKLGNKNK